MIRWVQKFWESDFQTKFFYFNWFLYSLLLIASTIYVYMELIKIKPTHDIQKVHETKIHK